MGRLPRARGFTPGHRWSRSAQARKVDSAASPRVAEVAAEEPRGADKRMSRDGQLSGRGRDPQLAGAVVDIKGLGEAELGDEMGRSRGIAGPSRTTPRADRRSPRRQAESGPHAPASASPIAGPPRSLRCRARRWRELYTRLTAPRILAGLCPAGHQLALPESEARRSSQPTRYCR